MHLVVYAKKKSIMKAHRLWENSQIIITQLLGLVAFFLDQRHRRFDLRKTLSTCGLIMNVNRDQEGVHTFTHQIDCSWST